MSEPITLTEGQYWKLRSIFANLSLQNIRIAEAQKQAAEDLEQHMAACGLDPAVNYELNDVTLSATPAVPKG